MKIKKFICNYLAHLVGLASGIDFYSLLIEKPSKNKKAWDVSIEDRREPVHGGLTAAFPAADILASHTPYLHKVNHFLSIKGVVSI